MMAIKMNSDTYNSVSTLFWTLCSAMRLYWVDAFFDKIEHSNFDGQNRISLDRITQISHPFGLTIFEGTLKKKNKKRYALMIRWCVVY